MQNPFSIDYDNSADLILIDEILAGSKAALERLIKRHQNYIYNVAHKMVMSPEDAEDITQDVLIKVITKLSQFKGKSNFRTWLYRITFNHMLSMKQRKLEKLITSFEVYGLGLDSIKDTDMTQEELITYKERIEEAKLGCIAGMLVCLNREQRLVYILGEIFDVSSAVGAELLDISASNFRKRLERARRDLYAFMNNKCGLINKANPCRCVRKTKGFIKRGWVDPVEMHFNAHYIASIQEKLEHKADQLEAIMTEGDQYKQLFQEGPFQEKNHLDVLMETIKVDESMKEIFNL